MSFVARRFLHVLEVFRLSHEAYVTLRHVNFLRRLLGGSPIDGSPADFVWSVLVEGRHTARGLGFYQSLIFREQSADNIEAEARKFLESRGDTFVRFDGEPRRVQLKTVEAKAVKLEGSAVIGATGRALFALDET